MIGCLPAQLFAASTPRSDCMCAFLPLQMYLHQLRETSGAAGTPPGVLRVLKSKACRGAIMFGQELGPGQQQQLLDNLAKTHLCFCCAHGRPTTAPLAELSVYKMLRRGITAEDGQQSQWTKHGLSIRDLKLKIKGPQGRVES